MMIQNVQNFTFKEVRPEYKKGDGTKVFPIAQDPNDSDITDAINATKIKKSKSGLNGFVYPLGADLVVKRYMGEGISHTYNPSGERKNLDRFFESGLIDPQIQKGMFGFETPDGVNYLVTTRIKGQNPSLDGKNLNRENLRAIASFLAKFDRGEIDKDGNYTRFMHYDLGTGNLNVSKKSAGVFDFEHSRFEKLEDYIKDYLEDRNNGADCNRGDIPPFPSNIRGFEYRTLERVLRNCDNPKEIFMNYLDAKSEYHFEMADNYEDLEFEASKLEKGQKKTELFRRFADKERIHAFVLKDAVNHPERNKDVIKAEAMKIQLARYIYTQSPFSNFSDDKFNPEQMKKYFEDAKEYFDQKASESKGSIAKQIYFEDCKKVMEGWDQTWNWTKFQMTEPNPAIEEHNPKLFKELVHNHELILTKIIDTKPKPLDEIVM